VGSFYFRALFYGFILWLVLEVFILYAFVLRALFYGFILGLVLRALLYKLLLYKF